MQPRDFLFVWEHTTPDGATTSTGNITLAITGLLSKRTLPEIRKHIAKEALPQKLIPSRIIILNIIPLES